MSTLIGTAGADTLVGVQPSNEMTGGAGADVFVYQRSATDTAVTDFGSIYFSASLAGQQENPPNPSAATGAFTGALNRARSSFDFTTTLTGVDLGIQTPATADNVVAAHFHLGPPGTNGGIVFGFLGAPNNDADAATTINPTTGVVNSEWHLAEGNNTTLAAQLANLMAGQLYVNFHTVALPGGEIRGQVLPVDTGADRIDLTGAHIGDFETFGLIAKAMGTSTLIATQLNGQVSNMMLEGAPLSSLTAADFIFADSTPAGLTGGALADDLFGAGGADTLSGGGGGDRLFAAAGADSVDGGDGNDTLFGQAGTDSLFGGLGNDSIQANAGADSVSAGDGNDLVFGGRDGDTLFGDAGNDTLSGDAGADILWGGAGADRLALRPGFGADWVGDFNFAEGDRIMLPTGATFTQGVHENQVLVILSTGDVIGLVGVPPASFSPDSIVFG